MWFDLDENLIFPLMGHTFLNSENLEHYENLAKGQAPKVIMDFLVYYYTCILHICYKHHIWLLLKFGS